MRALCYSQLFSHLTPVQEWDALMLETATLRESLDSRNKELSTALYQYDAACRVIARLEKERDDARAALAAAPAPKRVAEDAMEVEAQAGVGKRAKGLPADVLASIDATAASLSAARRKRSVSADLASVEGVSRYAELHSLPLHKSSAPGIAAVAVHPGRPEVSASGGADKSVVVYARAAGGSAGGRKLAELKGHAKGVTALAFLSAAGALVSGSEDRCLKLWAPEGGDEPSWRCAATVAAHAAPVSGVAVHPCGGFLASCARDGCWALWDAETGGALWRSPPDAPAAPPLAAVAFHPDGLILATAGADGCVRVWDTKSGASAAKLEQPQPLAGLSFSENGYHLAVAGDAGVALWDLRKLKCIRELGGGAPATAVAFDHSGYFLAAGGARPTVYAAKQEWAAVAEWEPLGGKKHVAALAWAPNAAALLVGASHDHTLRVYGMPSE